MTHTIVQQVLALHGLPRDTHGTPVELRDRGRIHLPQLFTDLGYRTGAEIGVWKGEFSLALCQGIRGLQLTCVDAWTPYASYIDYRRTDHMTQAYEKAQSRLAPYGVTFIRAFSREAASQVPPGTLDFVYIDANHSFESVVEDLSLWVPKVRSGGIVSGHDYFNAPRTSPIRVKEAIHGYTQAHDLDPWFVLGRAKVRPGEYTERERSWFFVTP